MASFLEVWLLAKNAQHSGQSQDEMSWSGIVEKTFGLSSWECMVFELRRAAVESFSSIANFFS
jgi:hypothetical protein